MCIFTTHNQGRPPPAPFLMSDHSKALCTLSRDGTSPWRHRVPQFYLFDNVQLKYTGLNPESQSLSWEDDV